MIVKVHDCVGVQNEGQNSNSVLVMLLKGNTGNILARGYHCHRLMYTCAYAVTGNKKTFGSFKTVFGIGDAPRK